MLSVCDLSEGSQTHVYPGRHSYILQLALPLPLGQGIVGPSAELSLPDCADKPRYLETGPSLGTFSIVLTHQELATLLLTTLES